MATSTTSGNLDVNYDTYLINATGGNLIYTLPPIVNDGMNFIINRQDKSTNTVTIGTTGSDIIVLTAGTTATSVQVTECIQLKSYQLSWYLVENSVTATFPPQGLSNIYAGRTNETINIDLLSGLTGIVSVNIIKPPIFGTLTATGATGSYTYLSNPRF